MRALRENPFFVLALPAEAARADVERAGQRLLAELELGRSDALWYTTPLGRERRTPDLVRQALAELRSPERRCLHAVWAGLAVRLEGSEPAAMPEPLSWAEAARMLGIRSD